MLELRNISKRFGDKQILSDFNLTIHEGWNHQVKRMFEAVELPVMKLKREEFGFLTLENLRPGDYRELRSFEVQKLRKLALDEK